MATRNLLIWISGSDKNKCQISLICFIWFNLVISHFYICLYVCQINNFCMFVFHLQQSLLPYSKVFFPCKWEDWLPLQRILWQTRCRIQDRDQFGLQCLQADRWSRKQETPQLLRNSDPKKQKVERGKERHHLSSYGPNKKPRDIFQSGNSWGRYDAGSQYHCGRVGRVIEPPSLPSPQLKCTKSMFNACFRTFRLVVTDQRTDGRTDKASYRVACPQLKMWS